MKNKRGIIKVSHQALTHHTGIFSRFNPIDIQIDQQNYYPDNPVYSMLGFSELFAELEEGEKTPVYEMTFTVNAMNDSIVMMERVYED